jgi:hypothetical protein
MKVKTRRQQTCKKENEAFVVTEAKVLTGPYRKGVSMWVTNYMEQIDSWEANSSLVNQKLVSSYEMRISLPCLQELANASYSVVMDTYVSE